MPVSPALDGPTRRALADIDAVLARCGASPEDPRVRTTEQMVRTPVGRSQSAIAGLNGETIRSSSRRVVTVDGNSHLYMTSIAACIERLATQQTYSEAATKQMLHVGSSDPEHVNRLLGILMAIRGDIEAGLGATIERLAEDAVFDDLIDMAKEIAKLHVAPAIVLAVSVLEERVRGLAAENDIAVEKRPGEARSFDELTIDLKGKGVITKTEYKAMASWYSQRTVAAHGHFDQVLSGDVPRVIDSVRDFLVRHT